MLQSQSMLRRGSVAAAVVAGVILSSLPALLPAVGLHTTPKASAALTTSPALNLVNARTVMFQDTPANNLTAGQPVPGTTTYTWMINKEDVGDPLTPMTPSGNCTPPSNGGSATYPDNCSWPSVRSTPGWVPIAASGNQDDWNSTTHIDLTTIADNAPGLGAGRYLVSVQADGYKVGGAHFTLNANGTVDGPITVSLQPWPLPLGTIRVKVFADEAPVDGVWEAGAEQGLAGFTVQGSRTSWASSPPTGSATRCAPTTTRRRRQGPVRRRRRTDRRRSNPASWSDADGDIVIPNLGRNRYGVVSQPTEQQLGADHHARGRQRPRRVGAGR